MIQRSSFGSAIYWLEGRPATMSRYLSTYYTPYDWDIIKNFFWENPIQAKIILSDFSKTNDTKLDIIVNEMSFGKSKIVIIVGARGSGKTCLSMFLVDELHKRELAWRIYFVGEDLDKHLFPNWIKVVNDINQVPNSAIAIVDEASVKFSARRSMDEGNILLTSLIATARHNDLTILFITQHLSLIDINVFRMRDMIFFLRSADYTIGERGGRTRSEDKFFRKIRNMMIARDIGECLFEQPSKRRFINFKFELPDFWNDEISKIFKNINQKEKFVKDKIQRAKDDEARKLNYFRKKAEIQAEVYAKKGIKVINKEEDDDGEEGMP